MQSINKIAAVTVSMLIIVTIVLGYMSFSKMWEYDLVIPGKGVTTAKWLSDYFPPLKGTLADTPVYILDSGKPGATVSVTAGVHPDEHATIAGIVMAERAVVETGKLIVIPQANNSAYTHSFPQEATPQYIHLKDTEGGVRKFRGGARGTNSIHFWPDPEVFVHNQTGQKLSGEEVRNLNRSFPGRPDGTFTEQIAYAVTLLVLQEKVDLNIDLHEAWPEYPFINAIGVHEKNADLGTIAAFDLRMQGVDIRIEMSPPKFRGLTYRELGDHTPAWAVLLETPNPTSGRIRGITDEKLIIEGQDAFYVRAAELGRTFVPFDEKGWPLSVRVARHLTSIQALLAAYTELNPDKPISVYNIPEYDIICETPVGHLLNPVSMAAQNR